MTCLIYVDILKEEITAEFIDDFFDQLIERYQVKKEEFRIQKVSIKGTLKFVYVYFKDIEFYKKLLHLDDEFFFLPEDKPHQLGDMFKYNPDNDKIYDLGDNLSLNCRVINYDKYYYSIKAYCNLNYDLRKDFKSKVRDLFLPFNSTNEKYPKVFFAKNFINLIFDDENEDCINAHNMFKMVKIDGKDLSFKPVYSEEE